MSNRKKAGIPRVFEDAGITVRWDPYERAVLTGASSPFARDQGIALHYEAIPVLDDFNEVAPLVEAGEHLYAIISNTGDPSGFAVAEVLEEPVLAPAPEESDADAMRRRAAAVAQHATRASIKDPSIVLGGRQQGMAPRDDADAEHPRARNVQHRARRQRRHDRTHGLQPA